MSVDAAMIEQIVEAMTAIYGRHEGQRLAHAKGVLCAATFTPAPQAAAELSRAAHFSGPPVRAHVRFSNGSGDPHAPDGERDGRGIGVKLYLPDGSTTDIVGLSLAQFFVRTPEDFLEFTRLRAPDPETGQPDFAGLGAFMERHSETAAAVQAALSLPPVASYAQTAYNSLHSFRFTPSEGESRYGRYRLTPEAGEQTLEDDDAKQRGPDYLREELAERLASGPAGFELQVKLAAEGDAVDDPTAAWPEDRETVVAGRLELTGLAFDRERDGDILVFDPNRLTDGIEASDDQILAVRSPAYSVSVERRSGVGPG